MDNRAAAAPDEIAGGELPRASRRAASGKSRDVLPIGGGLHAGCGGASSARSRVLLLRDVFDFDYDEIAALVGKSEAACRKLLERARQNVATEKRSFSTSPEVHRRMLGAFTQAAYAGDLDALVGMLADDAVLITDGGPEGRRAGGIRNLRAPLQGAARIAAFIVATARNSNLDAEIHELNGQPALVFYDQDAPFAALLLGVADARIHRVFFHADLARLRYLGPRIAPS